MTRAQYNEWWTRDDDITAEWLGQTSRWLGGMNSTDGSVIVTHNENGINLQVSPLSSGSSTSSTPITVSATQVDLAPQTQLSGGYLQTRLKKLSLSFANNHLSLVAAATQYGAWVNGVALCSATAV